MQYMCLIYDDESLWERLPEDERKSVYAEYGAFTQAIRDNGSYVAGDQLQPTSTATTVRIRDGKTMVTDGPFAETKEQLGGYYLIEAKDADEALKVAQRIPSARYGSIEVRPVVVWED
ncbi:MAG: YciI family protein [Verrucomicrobiota bacterium]